MAKIHDYLPHAITLDGRIYHLHISASGFTEQNGLEKEKKRLKNEGYLVRTLHVLSRNHRGKTDFHGRPYKPSTWLFIHKPIKN